MLSHDHGAEDTDPPTNTIRTKNWPIEKLNNYLAILPIWANIRIHHTPNYMKNHYVYKFLIEPYSLTIMRISCKGRSGRNVSKHLPSGAGFISFPRHMLIMSQVLV